MDIKEQVEDKRQQQTQENEQRRQNPDQNQSNAQQQQYQQQANQQTHQQQQQIQGGNNSGQKQQYGVSGQNEPQKIQHDIQQQAYLQQQQIREQQAYAHQMAMKNQNDIKRPLNPEIKGKRQFYCHGQLFTVDERYTISKEIGFGAYGVVCAAHDSKTNQDVAIKKIQTAFKDITDAQRVLREIKILKFFDHENIVKLVDIQRPPYETGYQDVYIITEKMEADLSKLIQSRQKLGDEHYSYFMYQLLRGVLYLHSANIMHRDIKPSNILVNINCDLKICDFGLARGIGAEAPGEDIEMTKYVVTRWYRAPEIALTNRFYNQQLDMWSIGCVFAELLLRQPILPGKTHMNQIKLIIQLLGFPDEEDLNFIDNVHSANYIYSLRSNVEFQRPKTNWASKIPNASPLAIDLLEQLLQFNPEKRIDVKEAIRHPYFKEINTLEVPPESETNFDWDWETNNKNEFTIELIQRLIYMESLCFHPEETDEQAQEQSQIPQTDQKDSQPQVDRDQNTSKKVQEEVKDEQLQQSHPVASEKVDKQEQINQSAKTQTQIKDSCQHSDQKHNKQELTQSASKELSLLGKRDHPEQPESSRAAHQDEHQQQQTQPQMIKPSDTQEIEQKPDQPEVQSDDKINSPPTKRTKTD